MNKQQYLNTPEVAEFINFLANIISGDISLNHKYFDRKIRKNLEFKSLYCGFEQYHWNNSNYETNKLDINLLVEKFESSNSKHSFFQACTDTLYWGAGNTDKLKLFTSNKEWLDNLDDVQENITEALSLLTSNHVDVKDFGTKYRSNAGFTKIYAFIKPDAFIIYDSRVAAALAYLIILFCQQTQRVEIPEYLQIKLAKGQGNSNRLPEIAGTELKFKEWGSNHKAHAISNVWANWIITEAFNKANNVSCNKFNNIREIEAALFMIGYDFPSLTSNKRVENQPHKITQIQKQNITADQVRLYTLNLITDHLKNSTSFEFTSSEIKKSLGGDLTAICSALKMLEFFKKAKINLAVISSPRKGLGRVTYLATKAV
ncbi:hypothetical protein [Thalassotalea profundi]|uniref:DUF3987 domain-containing protein n=1 Tax=Thalassotalea profundi TaxID=2036687 RepID=A0ABQ3J7C7_9GAMM|nr:hypothetical protein [Thalassotalea profundi]GHF02676.1 hypothetical protein GCM10011501_35040 [Thalassotalea profundi]